MITKVRNIFTAGLVTVLTAIPLTSLIAADVKLTILHFNDVYEISPKNGVGGLAELMTVIRKQRSLNNNTFVTLAGDFLSPSLLSSQTKGKHMIEIFNAIGLDVVSPGNHEFDFGPEILKERIKESKFPWIMSNVKNSDGSVIEGTVATLIKKVNGVSIGLLGILTPETKNISKPGSTVIFEDPILAAEAGVKELQKQGADIIIALTHLTIDQDRALAKAVPGIQVILGGHDHNPITFYEGDVFIHKSGSDADYLGVINLDIRIGKNEEGEKTRKVSASWCMIPIKGIEPDPEIASIVKKYNDQFDKALNVVIGKTLVELDSRRKSLRVGETTMGNLFADALKEGMEAQVSIVNSGTLRGDSLYPANSDLTKKDVVKELPLSDQVAVVVELKGSDLQEALENGVSRIEKKSGRFPQISGLNVVYNPENEPGKRILEVKIDGKPLDPIAIYKVATTGYMLSGGDDYTMLGKGKVIVDAEQGNILSTMFMEYITNKGTVAPKIDGRWIRK